MMRWLKYAVIEWWGLALCRLIGHKWRPAGNGREVCVRLGCRGWVERSFCSCSRPAPAVVYDANSYLRWCGTCGGRRR